MSIPAPVTPPQHHLRPALALALLALSALLPAIGAINAPFYLIDDKSMILKSPFVSGARPLWTMFTEQNFGHYAPLHEALIFIQRLYFGTHPLGYRVVSILLHFGASVACWKMLKALMGREMLALGLTMIWAAHPIQSESVAWIVEQKTLWFALFCFWSIAIYVDPSRPPARRLTFSLLLMAIGSLGKVSGLVVAPLLVLYEIFPTSGMPSQNSSPLIESRTAQAMVKQLSRRLLWTIPFILLAGVFTGLGYWAHRHMEESSTWGFRNMILNLPATLTLYFKAALCPWTVNFFHDMECVERFGSPAFLVPFAELCALFLLGWLASVKSNSRLFVFGALGWVAAIGPMLNVSWWTFPAYDRFQYMALPFLLLAVALVLEPLLCALNFVGGVPVLTRARSYVPPLPRLAFLIWMMFFILTASLGTSRGLLFGNELAVIRDAASKSPTGANAQAFFAATLISEWQLAKCEGREHDQKVLAEAIVRAANTAWKSLNWRIYVLPVNLLASTGEILAKSGYPEQGDVFLEAAATNPKWFMYKKEQNNARRILAELKIQQAEKFLMDAQTMGATAVESERLAVQALEEISKSRKWMRLALDSFKINPYARQWAPIRDACHWYEHIAFRRLDGLAELRGDLDKSREYYEATKAALQSIQPESLYYLQAEEELSKLKPPPVSKGQGSGASQ